jgi:diguanylate cyclase (GGDEF)-like protein
LSHRALIADPTVQTSSHLRRFLESAGFQVEVAHYLDEAVEALRTANLELLFAAVSANFDGETLSRKAKELRPRCPVVLIYPSDEENPGPHALEASADAYLVAPLKRGTVDSCARSMMRLRQLLETVQRLETDLRRHVAEPPRNLARSEGSSADFGFFKRFLLMEIKRSRRYRFPASFLLVALDRFPERAAQLSQKDRTMTLALVLAAITRGLRDIDLAVPASEDRFLVFLPHTSRQGATVVADRLRARVGKLKRLEGQTVSVGVACYEGDNSRTPVSFGGLMRDSTEALRRAQKAGGDRVELAAEPAKRDRIVMG